MPDYIMRWLASRFIDDVDYLESLGIMTDEVRARKDAQQAFPIEDTNGHSPNGSARATGTGMAPNGERRPTASPSRRPPRSPTPRRWSRPRSEPTSSSARPATSAEA